MGSSKSGLDTDDRRLNKKNRTEENIKNKEKGKQKDGE